MALRVKSIDEETTELADAYDALIAPEKIWRNHNNKLFLTLRAFAAGKVGLVDAALALHNRFNPAFCDESDLYAVAKQIGTEFKYGTGSAVSITIFNRNPSMVKTLMPGMYHYQSVSGIIFSFEVTNLQGLDFEPEEAKTVIAFSQEKGSFSVDTQKSITLFRAEGGSIDSAFVFSCESNADQLGYEDETAFDFRSRILSDINRQDQVRELELKIRNLPNIFECNLVINESVTPQSYDGILLAPKELLITITGTPTSEIARLVCESVIYDTHMESPDNVVWYENDLYINGRRPVYYRFHDKVNFSIKLTYEYDQSKIKAALVEDEIESLLKPYRNMTIHMNTLGEKDIYKALEKLEVSGVKILNVDIIDENDQEIPYVRIPRTKIPHLLNVTYYVEAV